MKIILEFGNKSGSHRSMILSNQKLATCMASSMVAVFENDCFASGARCDEWKLKKNGRAYWESETQFIAISKLDGILRGSASSSLWRKGVQLRIKQVCFEA